MRKRRRMQHRQRANGPLKTKISIRIHFSSIFTTISNITAQLMLDSNEERSRVRVPARILSLPEPRVDAPHVPGTGHLVSYIAHGTAFRTRLKSTLEQHMSTAPSFGPGELASLCKLPGAHGEPPPIVQPPSCYAW